MNYLKTANDFIDLLSIESVKVVEDINETDRVYWKGNIYEFRQPGYEVYSYDVYLIKWHPIDRIVAHGEQLDKQLMADIQANVISTYNKGTLIIHLAVYGQDSQQPSHIVPIDTIEFDYSIETEANIEAKQTTMQAKAEQKAADILDMKREYIVQIIKDGEDPLYLKE